MTSWVIPSTFIRSFESAKCGKEAKKAIRTWISWEQEVLLDEKKNIFHSF